VALAARAILLGPAAELILIGLWAAWVGRGLLDFDPFTWLPGREFGYQIEGIHFWTQLRECGQCALWNGGINGGYPALADLFSSKFHPFVSIPTLLWGTIVGAKVAIVLSFWLAGAAQWWLARTIQLGVVPRLWTGFLAVVAGHLAARLELGSPGLVVSTAASTLALAAAVDLAITGQRKSAVRLGIAAALAIVSGVGYLQLGLLVWMPALLFLLLDQGLSLRPVWKEFVLAGAISLLLTAVVLLPALHFLPNYEKFIDPAFDASQPMEFIPLNLVIRDHEFMRSGLLGKFPFEYLYHLYIGWVPILLALLCLRLAPRRDSRILLFLASGPVLTFFFASAIPMRLMVKLLPDLAGFRHTPLIAGMAIPGILGLAAYGLDRLLKLNWPRITLILKPDRTEPFLALSLAWVLAIPLVWSIRSAYNLSQDFTKTIHVESVYRSVDALRTPDLAWISTPYGEHYWVEPSIAAGLKLTNVVAVWRWKGHDLPLASLIAKRNAVPEDGEPVGLLQGTIPILRQVSPSYAYVSASEGIVPCKASGRGGDLTIECSTENPGQLVVQENSWSGWKVFVDGNPESLLPGPWLSAEAPAGKHEFRFLYRPSDVMAGLGISVVGVLLCLWLWRSSRSRRSLEPPPVASEGAESRPGRRPRSTPAPTPLARSPASGSRSSPRRSR